MPYKSKKSLESKIPNKILPKNRVEPELPLLTKRVGDSIDIGIGIAYLTAIGYFIGNYLIPTVTEAVNNTLDYCNGFYQSFENYI